MQSVYLSIADSPRYRATVDEANTIDDLVQSCLPRISRFADGGAYDARRKRVIGRMQSFYERFRTLARRCPDAD